MNRHHVLILACGLVLAGGMGAIASLRDLGIQTHPMLAFWGLAFAAYAVAAVTMLRKKAPRHALGIILGAGLLARMLLLPTAPTLSEDVYRYLWDGRLVARGVNPFPHAPSDPALAPYRNDLLGRLNHANVPTLYPPAAQFLFAVAAAVSETPLAWKLMLLLLETMLVAALLRLLRLRGHPPERLLLYYWNPLVLVESFGSGHVDLAAAAFLVLSLSFLEARRPVRAGLALALAMATKYVPALLGPWLARHRRWTVLATAAVSTAVLFAPFLSAGPSLGRGLLTYARHWEFNGALYPLLSRIVANDLDVRRLLAALLILATLAVAWRARTGTGAALASLAAFLLVSPTVFPWYLVPAIALLPLHPDPGMIAFSGLVALSYLPLPGYRATGVWSLPGWIPCVEYGGLVLAWAAAISAGRAGVDQRKHAHVQESKEVEHEKG